MTQSTQSHIWLTLMVSASAVLLSFSALALLDPEA